MGPYDEPLDKSLLKLTHSQSTVIEENAHPPAYL